MQSNILQNLSKCGIKNNIRYILCFFKETFRNINNIVCDKGDKSDTKSD